MFYFFRISIFAFFLFGEAPHFHFRLFSVCGSSAFDFGLFPTLRKLSPVIVSMITPLFTF
jgi:hypothetical protein